MKSVERWQTNKHTNKQTNKQTHKQTYILRKPFFNRQVFYFVFFISVIVWTLKRRFPTFRNKSISKCNREARLHAICTLLVGLSFTIITSVFEMFEKYSICLRECISLYVYCKLCFKIQTKRKVFYNTALYS